MYSAREAGFLANPVPEVFEGLSRNDLEDLCNHMLFDIPLSAWRDLKFKRRGLSSRLSNNLEFFITRGIFAHAELPASQRLRLGISEIRDFQSACDDRIWKAAFSEFEAEIPKGSNREHEFNRLFAKYMALCKSIEVSDPFMAKNLCAEDTAATWLLEGNFIPLNKSVEIHSQVIDDWDPLVQNIQSLLDANPKYSGEIDVKLYFSKDKRSQEGARLFHDRHLVFKFSKGSIPVCLGSGADTFAVEKTGKNVGKLIGNAQVYSSSPAKYNALLSEQSESLLRAQSRTVNKAGRRIFQMHVVRRAN
jgi:hypothetical protein